MAFSTRGQFTGKKADCLESSVHLGTVLLKDKELTRYNEHGKKQLLLTVVTLILTRLTQLPNWSTLILTCQLTPSATG